MSRKSLKKRLLSSPVFLGPAIAIASVILRAIYITNRKTFHMPESIVPYKSGQAQAIYCFWHGRMMANLFVKPSRRRMYVLTTRHTDGLIASMLCRCFGIRTVWGTRSKGAAAAANAARALLDVVRKGYNISITPDGPRGPFQQAAPGAVYLASKSGHPIVSVTFSATRYKRLRSWDRFMIFMPFGHIHYVVGEPIHVAPDADEATIHQTTLKLAAEMNRLTEEADRLCGVGA